MNGTVLRFFPRFHCKLKLRFLASTWMIGLISGALSSLSADELITPTMRAAVISGMSISGLIAVILLPLLLSAYAVCFSHPIALVLVSFLKAFLFAYTASAVLITYATSGWLVLWLLLFSDMWMLPILWWLWLCAGSAPRDYTLHRFCFCAVFAMLIGCVDFTLIAPFMARLI